MNDGIPMTAAGYERLTKELEHLKSVERPALVAEIEKAPSKGYNILPAPSQMTLALGNG